MTWIRSWTRFDNWIRSWTRFDNLDKELDKVR